MPILLAFSVFGLLAAGFIIANVVSGIVLTSYRDIGVMKAVGYTPVQVVAILLAEILVPATIAVLLGVGFGTVASQPILAQTARSFGLPEAFRFSRLSSLPSSPPSWRPRSSRRSCPRSAPVG